MDVETIKVGPVDVQLVASDDRIVASIRGGKPFEPASLPVWADMCAGGGTVLDIGCYSGLYAIAAAKLGCKVRAFEPMPRNVERIKKNAAMNGVTFDLTQCVVANTDGATVLTFNPNVVGLTSGASLIRKTGGKLPVKSITVDGLALADCAAVKIDVERAEPMVLRGMKGTIARFHPLMLVEALSATERAAVEQELPGYYVRQVLDVRNLWMVPC